MPLRSSIATSCRKCLGAALPLLLLAALLLSAGPARSAEFTDAAGRRVMLPAVVAHVMPADRNAEVLVLVLAPDKLAGLGRVPSRRALPGAAHIPVIGWGPRGTPASMAAAARRLHADLIVDAGPVTPARAAFADRVEALSGIPYILVDDSFERMPQMLRAIGAVLGVGDRADDLALYADHAIAGLRGRLLIAPPDTRPHVYFALGQDGLTTALPDSPAGAAIDEAGAINVAGALGRGGEAPVSPAQLFAWNPGIIIAERRSAYDALRHRAAWRRLAAVRDNRVYLEPTGPFGWITDPAGVNRVIGLHWLSVLFYPSATQEELRTTVCDFYDRFYRIKLTNAQVEAMVRPAGIPPEKSEQPAGQLPLGLGPTPARPGLPKVPGAPTPPGAGGLPPVPGLPSTAPSATCTVPTGPTPQPLPGVAAVPDVLPSVAADLSSLLSGSPAVPGAPPRPLPGVATAPEAAMSK
jgi:iron complex transport system substrate-binding protein